MSHFLTVSCIENPISCKYYPPIDLSGTHELALVSILTHNNFCNISDYNNVFRYQIPSGKDVDIKEIVIDPGKYKIKEIFEFLNNKLKATLKDIAHCNTKQNNSIAYGIDKATNFIYVESCVNLMFENEDKSLGKFLSFPSHKFFANTRVYSKKKSRCNRESCLSTSL